CYVVDDHCIRTIHAEINALLQCAKFGVSTEGAEIYVTHFPCVHCSKALIQAGIKKVHFAADYKNHPYALELFEQTGVEVVQVELEEMSLDQKHIEKMSFTAELLEKLERSGIEEEEMKRLR